MAFTKTGLKNVPNVSQIDHLRMLCVNILEPLRERIGQPIYVNSAFRSPLVNKAVGGVATSQHLTGDAADIKSSVQTSWIWNAINDLVLHGSLNIGQCIWYRKSNFIHISNVSRTHENDFIIRNK